MLRERRRHAHYKLNSRLDRKSSRGMIYENEELRLRTININAEVERGQSDIKRLRRENEQLRREIWTLRDECDRLNKRFKAKLNEHEFGGCRGSGGSGGTCHAYRCSGGRGSGGCDVNSDDSDSCDTCRGADDGHCSDECCQEGVSCAPPKPPLPPEVPTQASPSKNEATNSGQGKEAQPMHFDHLSVVSEETLSNPELLLAQHQEHLMISPQDPNGSQSTLPSLMGPLTPLTPIELVANQLSDLQATVPPLSYFENILQQHIGGRNPAQTPSPELGTSSSTTTGQTMRHTNGWDYNLQSPFSQRKYSAQSSPSCSPPPPLPPPGITMTTFVPTSAQQTMPKIALNSAPQVALPPEMGDIETVAITTNATQQALNSPKHFFAPIKPRLKLNTKLANESSPGQGHEQDDLPPGSPPPPLRDPPDIFVNNALASPYQRRISPQTDSVNLESILNDIETISEDILAIQLEKSKSRDNLSQDQNKDDVRAKKPYRSEMNLYLQYDGTNPTISPATATTEAEMTAATTSADSISKLLRRTRSLEREHTDSPAPHIPDPMAPFPDKRTYLGFEQINQAVVVSPSSPNSQRPPIAAKPNMSQKPPPPLPPARRPTMPSEPPPPPPTSLAGLTPNKSQLYKTLASAAAKRAIFRSSPSQITRSLDVDLTGSEASGEVGGEQAASGDLEELARRKARRVSIVCGNPGQQDEVTAPVTTAPTATASCVDLSTVLQHPSVKAFKQISHSTPSSPHSSRRRTNSNSMTPSATGGHPEVGATASAPPSTSHHHHHRKESSDPVPMTATVSRTKCSRRHSEGTVHNVHRNSSASGGGGGHHHHHSHHHPHSGMVISSNPHHSHHSHQDSNHETVTSLSDRNSNSFASSRESSTSFSMRSNRRKISISSHTGGKIPWCGCWGNGCL
ncbi:verprolin isoform X8 [Drosophila ananassae]|uniref:verprolin isoform X8 n=1 Tax=Drosophila ananassae TaxID=7217 RepID=UPI0013A5E766|nr:verprolin isoform X8 [Drosophila ananassae]